MKYQALPLIIEASKIERIETPDAPDAAALLVTLADGSKFYPTEDQLAAHVPLVGDYAVERGVVYDLMAAADFEAKYAPAFQ